MGLIRMRQGRNAEAAVYLRKALTIDPGFQQAARDLAQVQRNLIG
jgi:Tfp pilus assembly protein PilF